MLFDLLVYSSNNETIKEVADVFRKILAASDEAVLQFSDFIIKDDCSEMIRILLKCPDHQARECVANILSTAVNRLFALETDILGQEEEIDENTKIPKSKAERFMLHVIGAIHKDCAANWTKFEHFFKLILNVTIGGEAQLEFMHQQKLITTLTDFFLGGQSPIKAADENRTNIGNNFQRAVFESLIATVCYISRNSQTKVVKPDNEIRPQTLIGDKLYEYSEADYTLIINKNFIHKAIRQGYEADQVGKLIAHWSYGSREESELFANVFLTGINTSDFDEVQPYLTALHHFLRVQDDLQQERLEWMFGVTSVIDATPAPNANVLSDSTAPGAPPTDLPEVGVHALKWSKDQVFDYYSTLIWHNFNQESVLSIVWKHSDKSANFTLLCIKEILTLMKEDQIIMKYIARQGPPTYGYARYTDWFGEFVQKKTHQQTDEQHAMMKSLYDEYLVNLKVFENELTQYH